MCSELLFYQISWNSNERFRRNQCISTKFCSHNFLVNCACAAFDRILDLSRSIHPFQKGRVFSNSITFNTLKNKRFWHITNCLVVKTDKKNMHNLHWIKWNGRCTGSMFVFLKALGARLFSSAVQIVERAQTMFRHLKSSTWENVFTCKYHYWHSHGSPIHACPSIWNVSIVLGWN